MTDERTYQTAVVTGASSGIGLATVLRMAAEGLTVFGTVRSEASGEALLDAAAGGDVRLVVADVTDTASVERAAGQVLDAVGHVDVLVNNAGISGSGAVEDMPIDTFERQMDTNAFGTLRWCQALLPSMRERGGGAIASITSVAGRLPTAGMAAYNMSKHAQEALTECLAHELAPFDIRVVAIEPGVVRTPIFHKAADNMTPPSEPYVRQADRTTRNFVGALADPATAEDVADVVWRSITEHPYRLRHAATPDGARVLRERAAVTDEEWLATATQDDDAAWAAWQSAVRGYRVS